MRKYFIYKKIRLLIDQKSEHKSSTKFSNQEIQTDNNDYENTYFQTNRKAIVLAPKTITEGRMSKYKLYPISSTKIGNDEEQEITVHRRYKDFEWLFEQLQIKNDGNIIPSLPVKNLLTKLDLEGQEFLEERRKCLEKFQNKILSHVNLSYNNDVAAFQSLEEKEFYIYREENTELDDEDTDLQEKFWDVMKVLKKTIVSEDNYATNLSTFDEEFIKLEKFGNWMLITIKSLFDLISEKFSLDQDLQTKNADTYKGGHLYFEIVDKNSTNSTSKKLLFVSEKIQNLKRNCGENQVATLSLFEDWLHELSDYKFALDRRTGFCNKYESLMSKRRKSIDEEYAINYKRCEKLKERIEIMSLTLKIQANQTMKQLERKLDELLTRLYMDGQESSEDKLDSLKC